MLSYTSAVTIALDATPLTVSTGGVGRYTLELARALASRVPGRPVLAPLGPNISTLRMVWLI